ncbi:hypothetical protein M427DRAFT_53396 [Gonapodya prolifera JEL478]|uniref:Uncharacterized protein n=1 Tax=Gonapodya prolifera (strain JEL478) TaxID=1344416 RepID=A0A139AQZ1_GONPJ|nr:hypothetical protein M427DRAFT_53396 [Gonapodya prolifera JEL478]|eukprot:KXS18915.1 hypothetical protein M427DRAFT_53396 [Gonapodya prolifera JEL478]
MGVDDVMVDSWVEEMRKWLHSKIFQPLTILLDNTDAYLRSQGLLHLTSSNAIWSDANPASLSALIREAQTPPQASLVGGPRPFAGAGSIFTPAPAPQMTMPQDLKGLSDVAKVMVGETKAIILTRLRLEAYLNVGKVGSPKNRAYVRERIFELSRNTYLSGYRWDSGGSFEGQEWDVKGEFPTDAKLVFHLFQTFMDQWSDVAQSGFPYFSTNHVIPSNAKLDPNSRSVYLREQNASPPHYQLLVQGCTWDMAQGSRNIFETISAFVCVIGRDAGWRVGDLDLKRKDLGIAKVVKGGLGAENAMW